MYNYRIFLFFLFSTNNKQKYSIFRDNKKGIKVAQLLEDKIFFNQIIINIKNKHRPNIYVLCNFYHSALDNKLKYLNLYFIINEFLT